jgi:flavin prenyltransferase
MKEGRRLVLVVREMPLSVVHLENMLKLARMGVCIMPPMPAFYDHPKSLEDMVGQIVARVLEQFDIDMPFMKRWDGEMQTPSKVASLAAAKGQT